MVSITAIVAFVVGLAIGTAGLQVALRRVGPTLEEWKQSGRNAPAALWLLSPLLALALVITRGTAREVLWGGVLGVCAPFLTEGIRRWLRERGPSRLR